MSDELRQSLSAHDAITGGGDPHEHLSDVMDRWGVQGGHHSLAHLSARPHSFEPHETDYHPPLQPRNDWQLEELPPQKADIENPFSFMRTDLGDIWHDPNKSFFGKALETLSVPGHAMNHLIAQATHTPEDPEHHLTLTVMQMLRGNAAPAQEGVLGTMKDWGAGLLGATAEVALDPINFMGFGAGRKALEGAAILKRPPTNFIRSMADTAKQAEPLAKARSGFELTKETIPRAAEKMSQERLASGWDKAAEQFSGDTEKLDAAQKDFSELQTRAYARGAENSEDFARRLGEQRSKIKAMPWGVSHPEVSHAPAHFNEFHSELPMETRLDRLAGRQALDEAQMAHELPQLALYGMRTKIPSPFPVIGNAVSKVFRNWNELKGFSNSIKDVAASMEPDAGKELLHSANRFFSKYVADGGKAEDLPMGSLYDRVRSEQIGRGVDKDLSARGPGAVGLLYGNPASKWAETHVLQYAPQEREAEIRAINGFYNAMHHVISNEPRLAVPGMLSNIKEGINNVRNALSNPEILSKVVPPEEALSYVEKTKKLFNDSDKEIHGLFGGVTPTGEAIPSVDRLKQLSEALDKNDPNAAIALMHEYHKSASALNGIEAQQSLKNWLTAYDDMVHAHTPIDVTSSHLKDLVDFQKKGRQLQGTANIINRLTDKLKEHNFGSALEMMGMYEKPLWNSLIGELRGGDKAGSAKEILEQSAAKAGVSADEMIGNVKKAILTETAGMVKDGRMTSEGGQRVADLMKGLDNEGVFHLADFMNDTARLRKSHEGAISRLTQYGLSGIQPWLSSMQRSDVNFWNRFKMPFEDKWAYTQWVQDPTKLGRWWSQHLEPIQNAVLRKVGWPQKLIENAAQYEGEHNSLKLRSERGALPFIEHQLPESLARQGVSLDMKGKDAIDKAVTQVWDNEKSLLPEADRVAYTDALSGTSLSRADRARMEKALAVDTIAQRLHGEGMATLSGLVPEPERLISDIKASFKNGHTDALRDAELKQGMQVLEKGDYLPRFLKGSYSEQQRFYRTMKEMKARLPGFSRMGTGKPVLSELGSFERQQGFRSWAELEHELENVNQFLKENNQLPLKLQVDPSLTSRLAMRYYQHHNSMNNLRFIRGLADVLPNHAIDFLPAGVKGKGSRELAKLASERGMVNLGELVPALKNWYVSPKFHDFVRDTVGFAEEPTGAAAIQAMFQKPLMAIQKYLKHLNTTFSGVHIKNTMSNAVTQFGPDVLARAAQIVGESVELAKKAGKFEKPRLFSPVSPIAKSLEHHPLFEPGLRNGLFHAGNEYEMPLQDLIQMRINPGSSKDSVMRWVAQHKLTGWTNTLTFDLVDRSLRMAAMEKLMKQGFTEARAAELANLGMVDYSMRYLTPGARRLAQTTMTFPAWTFGNWMLHGKNMIENPAWYALAAHAADAYNEERDGFKNPHAAKALAGAYAMGHTVPGTNNQVWLKPDFPWQSTQNMMYDTMDELSRGNILAAGMRPGQYMANHLLDQYRLLNTFMARGGTKAAEKKGVVPFLVGEPGKPEDTGMMGQVFWGANSYGIPGWAKILVDPSMWSKAPEQWQRTRLPLPGADTRGFLENLFTRTVDVSPEGKVHY